MQAPSKIQGQSSEEKVLCDKCNHYRQQSQYIAHWERCKGTQISTSRKEDTYPKRKIQFMQKKQRKTTKIKGPKQHQEKKEQQQQNIGQEQQRILCNYCGYMMSLSELDTHLPSCQATNDIECQHCFENYPANLMADHHAVCEIKINAQGGVRLNFEQGAQFLANIELLMQLLDVFNNKKQGLTQEERDLLPIKKYQQVGQEQDKCTVCMQKFNDEDEVIILECKHLYHTNCIRTWLEKNSYCPNCKKDLKKKKEGNQ